MKIITPGKLKYKYDSLAECPRCKCLVALEGHEIHEDEGTWYYPTCPTEDCGHTLKGVGTARIKGSEWREVQK